ncbi:peptidoglycan DD-metalloendopeptidase family protein [Solicola sp. PLA-1-18]|uniref:peptidoglycan DD-metalloendopeptidase family protein n=1 Tax=Solicola sp. PLA-1-18 TaxID=3380532 RepID=UPI003B7F939C
MIRAARTRLTLATTGVCATLVLTLAPPSPAADEDRLEQRRRSLSGQISGAQQSIDESSKGLARASAALDRVQGQLTAAQTTLTRTRGQLASAAAQDQEMARRLGVAQRTLITARRDLRAGRRQLEGSERTVKQQTLTSLEQGDPGLRAMAALLSGSDPLEFNEQMMLGTSVADAQLATMDRLDAARIMLEMAQDKVESARDEVAAQRGRAADNLALRRRLEAAAERQTSAVGVLVADASSARTKAESLRQADLAELGRLEGERTRVSTKLRAIARAEAAEEARQEAKRRRDRARAKAGTGAGRDDAAAPAPPRQRDDSSAPSGDDSALIYPVSSFITSPYGMRLHPILKVRKLHDGTDFRAPCGSPVKAAATGRVLERYFNTAYGNRVILSHGRKRGTSVATTYNHLARSIVRVGQKVRRGQTIGYAGTTGYSTGCHLHLMVLEDGNVVNPMRWL